MSHTFSWKDTSIELALSLPRGHPAREEITRLKAHIEDLGFTLQGSSKTGHCYVDVHSKFKILGNSLVLEKQQRTVKFNPKCKMIDLLHELDHVYQLCASAQGREVDFVKSSSMSIITGSYSDDNYTRHPAAIVEKVLMEMMKQNQTRIDGSTLIDSFKTKSRSRKSRRQGQAIINPAQYPGLSYKSLNAINTLIESISSLDKKSKRLLFSSHIYAYENSHMEIAAYTRELQREKTYPSTLTLPIDVTEQLHRHQRWVNSKYQTSSFFSPDSRTNGNLFRKIPHVYCESIEGELTPAKLSH